MKCHQNSHKGGFSKEIQRSDALIDTLVGEYQREKRQKLFFHDVVRCLSELVSEDSRNALTQFQSGDIVKYLKTLQLKDIVRIQADNMRLREEIGAMQQLNEKCKQILLQQAENDYHQQEELEITTEPLESSEEDIEQTNILSSSSISGLAPSPSPNEALELPKKRQKLFFHTHRPLGLISRTLSNRLERFIQRIHAKCGSFS